MIFLLIGQCFTGVAVFTRMCSIVCTYMGQSLLSLSSSEEIDEILIFIHLSQSKPTGTPKRKKKVCFCILCSIFIVSMKGKAFLSV